MKIIIAIAAIFTVALVQSRVSNAEADPANAKTAVPASKYESPFRDYRPFGEDKPIPWKDANDDVARIGGWRAYAKEAREPQAPTSVPEKNQSAPATPQPPAPAAPAHAGHGQQK